MWLKIAESGEWILQKTFNPLKAHFIFRFIWQAYFKIKNEVGSKIKVDVLINPNYL